MALVIDTGDLAETERLDTLAEVLRGSTGVAAAMDPVDPAGPVAAVVHLWQLGPGANLRVQSGTGFRLRRTARHVRMGGPEALCLTLRHGGRFRVVQHEADIRGTSPELTLTELTSPFETQDPPRGQLLRLTIDVATLGLPIDLIRRAAPTIAGSPLHDLVAAHLARVASLGEVLSDGPVASGIGAASAELLRALVAGAARSEPHTRAAMADSLRTRIGLYIGRNLGDPDLSPDTIARFHSISLRHLYNVWGTDPTISRWILSQRLEKARRMLARSETRLPISTIAARCGFVDTSHFSRRFRMAYDMTPSEWRDLHP